MHDLKVRRSDGKGQRHVCKNASAKAAEETAEAVEEDGCYRYRAKGRNHL